MNLVSIGRLGLLLFLAPAVFIAIKECRIDLALIGSSIIMLVVTV